MARIIFVTGTDTNVGKTVLTSLLLDYLMSKSEPVLPLKLFCSGDRSDAEQFYAICDCRFSLDQINPWFFPQPVTPLIAAREAGVHVSLAQALEKIHDAAKQCSTLLVEGAGGLLSPLGEDFTALDLIIAVKAEVIVVAPNKLGTLNHCSLTVRELRRAEVDRIKLVLMGQQQADISAKTNVPLLQELLGPIEISEIPWLEKGTSQGWVTELEEAEGLSSQLKKLLDEPG